jgi:single-stranded DNA-specific DHH superfamily exonuclease
MTMPNLLPASDLERSKDRINQAVLRNGKTCIHTDVQTLFFG